MVDESVVEEHDAERPADGVRDGAVVLPLDEGAGVSGEAALAASSEDNFLVSHRTAPASKSTSESIVSVSKAGHNSKPS